MTVIRLRILHKNIDIKVHTLEVILLILLLIIVMYGYDFRVFRIKGRLQLRNFQEFSTHIASILGRQYSSANKMD